MCRKNAPYATKKYTPTAVHAAVRRQQAAPPKRDIAANVAENPGRKPIDRRPIRYAAARRRAGGGAGAGVSTGVGAGAGFAFYPQNPKPKIDRERAQRSKNPEPSSRSGGKSSGARAARAAIKSRVNACVS